MPYIRYNSANKNRARENRAPMTKAEKRIRFWVLKERPLWCKFIRQKMIGFFILDFYCSRLLLGIEIDGSSHDNRQEYDRRRTEKLKHMWIKIIRYKNEDVYYNLDYVAKHLTEELKKRKKEQK